ncbi:hypothetical protein IQ06DRAFT_43313 [Phaeosphaeriaceae sp. SRC1lsM3a]|nr:hypothetical protein IQ06DRAFT_43313 [Stagonospora sp. SRC1lsM3a]
MRLSTLLPAAVLAATSYAEEPAASSTPVKDPPTAGEVWKPKWDTVGLQPYTQHCLNRNTYTANIYKLSERTSSLNILAYRFRLTMAVYPDLKEFAPDLKIFYNKQLYAGSWDGVDHHGTKRELMRMDLNEMPYKVREWLKRETKQKHFSIQDNNVFFAPGAIYPILPLWVDEPDTNNLDCEDVFDDLELYSSEPADGKVVGKLTHSDKGKKEVQFTVEALLLKKKGKAPTRKEGSDEL